MSEIDDSPSESGFLRQSPLPSPTNSETTHSAKERLEKEKELEDNFVAASLEQPPNVTEIMSRYRYNCNTVMVYRIFRGSVQRVERNTTSLKSYASFIVVDDKNEALIIWHGCICDKNDQDMAVALALRVVTLEYKQTQFTEEDLPTIVEGDEKPNILSVFFKMMDADATKYSSKLMISARREQFSNSSASTGIIRPFSAADTEAYGESSPKRKNRKGSISQSRSFFEVASRKSTNGGFVLREFAHNDVDASGAVARLPFYSEITNKTVAYVCVGDQWDIWAARGVSLESLGKAILCVENVLLKQLHVAHSEEVGSVQLREMLTSHIRVVNQLEERILFRYSLRIFTDFDPNQIANVSSSVADSKSVETATQEAKDRQGEAKSEAIGDAVLASSMKKKVSMNEMSETQRASAPPSPRGDTASGKETLNWTKSFFEVDPAALGQNRLGFNVIGTREVDVNEILNLVGKASNEEKQQEAERQKEEDENADAPPPIVRRVERDEKGQVQVVRGMLLLREDKNCSAKEAYELKERSATNPELLLGWQIEIEDGIDAGVYVVVSTSKSMVWRQTVFGLSSGPMVEEIRLKLMRGGSKKKQGHAFRLLRKVYNPSDMTTLEVEGETPTVPMDGVNYNDDDDEDYGNMGSLKVDINIDDITASRMPPAPPANDESDDEIGFGT